VEGGAGFPYSRRRCRGNPGRTRRAVRVNKDRPADGLESTKGGVHQALAHGAGEAHDFHRRRERGLNLNYPEAVAIISAELVTALAGALRDCAAWHGTPEVLVNRSDPPDLAGALRTAVEDAAELPPLRQERVR